MGKNEQKCWLVCHIKYCWLIVFRQRIKKFYLYSQILNVSIALIISARNQFFRVREYKCHFMAPPLNTCCLYNDCLSSHNDELFKCLLSYNTPFCTYLYASVKSLLEAQVIFMLWTELLEDISVSGKDLFYSLNKKYLSVFWEGLKYPVFRYKMVKC